MTRLDELTIRLIDGELSPDEERELARLLEAGDDAAVQGHVALFDVETALRGGAHRDAQLDVLAAAVMGRVSRPPPGQERNDRPGQTAPGRRWVMRWLPLGLGLTAAAAFALVAVERSRTRARPAAQPESPLTPQQPAPPRLQPPPGTSSPAARGEAATSAPARAPQIDAVSVVAFDFEDGQTPELIAGGLASQGCAGGSRFCALSGINLIWAHEMTVQLDRPTLFHYAPTLVVAFDYRIAGDISELTVQLRDRDTGQNYHHFLLNVRHDGWAHAEVRLIDFKPHVRANEPMQPGDRLGSLIIMAGRPGGSPFYIDNVVVLDYGADRLPPRSTASAPPGNNR